MMKKYFIIAALSLALVSCKTVTMEDQIDNIFEFVNSNDDFQHILEQAENVSPLEYVDYYMYVLSEKMKVKDILSQSFTVENSSYEPVNVIADIPGKNEDSQMIIISAEISDPVAAVTAIETFYTMKKAKVRHNNTIRLVLYDTEAGYRGYCQIARSRAEAHFAVFEINHDIDHDFSYFKTNESSDIFDSVEGLAIQYCSNHYPVKFEYDDGIYNINPHYEVVTDKESGQSFENLLTNTSAIASIICLLN